MTVTATQSADTRNGSPKKHAVPSRLVTGTVLRFRHDKGYGFASIDGENDEVFLHNSFGREVTGAVDEPKLTRTPTSVDVVDAASGSESPSRIIMQVVPGAKGLRAIAWGILPTDESDWKVGLFNVLQGYVSGEITSQSTTNVFLGQEFCGTLQVLSVKDNVLEISIGEPQQRNGRGHYIPLTNPPLVKLSYDLTDARPDGQPGSQYSIVLPEGKSERRITFNRPKQA